MCWNILEGSFFCLSIHPSSTGPLLGPLNHGSPCSALMRNSKFPNTAGPHEICGAARKVPFGDLGRLVHGRDAMHPVGLPEVPVVMAARLVLPAQPSLPKGAAPAARPAVSAGWPCSGCSSLRREFRKANHLAPLPSLLFQRALFSTGIPPQPLVG